MKRQGLRSYILQSYGKYLSKIVNNGLSWRIKNYRKYLFWRWITYLLKNKKKERQIICSVAGYLYKSDPHGHKVYTDIFFLYDTLYIVTRRPGLWIGKGGEGIDKLQEAIKEEIRIRIIEDNATSQYHIPGFFTVFANYV